MTEITMMTNQELKEVKAWYNGFAWDRIASSTAEEKNGLMAHATKLRKQAEAKLEEAQRYRPSYAPKGKETRSERQGKALVRQQRKFERAVYTIINS